jgi:hypothetical protein
VAPTEPLCGGAVSLGPLTNSANQLSMDITNNGGTDIVLTRLFAYWLKTPTSQKLDKLFLNGLEIWNKSDPDSPSDIPAEGNFVGGADLTIPAGALRPFVIQFAENLQATGYEVHIVFNVPCQVIGNN